MQKRHGHGNWHEPLQKGLGHPTAVQAVVAPHMLPIEQATAARYRRYDSELKLGMLLEGNACCGPMLRSGTLLWVNIIPPYPSGSNALVVGLVGALTEGLRLAGVGRSQYDAMADSQATAQRPPQQQPLRKGQVGVLMQRIRRDFTQNAYIVTGCVRPLAWRPPPHAPTWTRLIFPSPHGPSPDEVHGGRRQQTTKLSGVPPVPVNRPRPWMSRPMVIAISWCPPPRTPPYTPTSHPPSSTPPQDH